MPIDTPVTSPHVVVVGAGFGGLAAARGLARAPVTVTIVDRRNYHLFQPLLYQVATAALSPADIAAPIRGIVSRHDNIRVRLGYVDDVDIANRLVMIKDQQPLSFDYLVVATGARHDYFGNDEWERFAPGLKKVHDATRIRERVLLAFEKAETEVDPQEQKRLLTFVVVGGGASGVELAGALAELAKRALARDFRRIDPTRARIVLAEAGDRLLPGFADELAVYAKKTLDRLGVEVRLGRPVSEVEAGGAMLGDETIEARTVIWAAGVMASPAGRWLSAERDKAGRVKVDGDLSLPGHPHIYVIGDTAHVPGPSGEPLPGVAAVAKQAGVHAASSIRAVVEGRPRPGPFHYRDYGNLATLGRHAAVADFGGFTLKGFPAWFVWAVAHIWFLVGFRNRLVVLASWFWAYLTFERGARLITDEKP